MSVKVLNILLILGLSMLAHAQQRYQLSRKVIIFGEANGVAVSLLQLLSSRNFETVFVFNGQHQYDTEALIPKHASQVIQCSMVDTEYQKCEALVAYAGLSEPLDVIIDLQSDSVAEISAIYGLFEATRKPRIYAYLASHSIYASCSDTANVREFGEYHCPPVGDKLVPIPSDMHAFEYEAGQRFFAVEKELNLMFENRKVSYLALRAAPLISERESLESFVDESRKGEKKARFLTYLLLSGVAAHSNQTISVPNTYRNMKWSVLFGSDLSKMAGAIEMLASLPADQPFSRTYNLASARITLKKLIVSLGIALRLSEQPNVAFVEESELPESARGLFYPDFFPATRNKPIDVGYAQHELRFAPTDLAVALGETVAFYREALLQFDAKATPTHVDEPIRVAIDTLVKSGLCTHQQIDEFVAHLRTLPAEATGAQEPVASESREAHTEL